MIRNTPDIAVIGAGPAGLACAERLAEHGLQVQVFDKGRSPGGRIAVRRQAGLVFEHGAPGLRPDVERLASRVPVLQRTRVTALEREGRSWRLHVDGIPLRARYGNVVVAVPAPQAATLLPDLAPMLQRVTMEPVLTALLGLQGRLGQGRDHHRWDEGSLAEARRQTSDRTGAPEAWVLHASRDFSRDNVECDPDAVAQHLWQGFRSALDLESAAVTFLRGHRWRYARTSSPLNQSCWHDPTLNLGLCGDWCLGDGVQAAMASGRALAARLLDLTERAPRRTLLAGGGQA